MSKTTHRSNKPEREGLLGIKDRAIGKLSQGQVMFAEGVDNFNEYVCRSMAKRPLMHFFGYWGVMFLILIVILAGGYLELAQIALLDFMIPTVQDVKNDFALTAGLNEVKESADFVTVVNHRGTRVPLFSFFFLYEKTEGDLLTPENVRMMCLTESQLLNDDLFPQYCVTANLQGNNGAATECAPNQATIQFFFYELFEQDDNEDDCPLLDDAVFQQRLTQLTQNPNAGRLLDNPLDPTFARSTAFLGGPLGSDTNPPGIDFDEIEDIFLSDQGELGYANMQEDFKSNIFDLMGVENKPFDQGFGRKFFSPPGSTLKVRVHGFQLEFLEFQSVVQVDSLISGGSFVVVTTLVFLYTRSCFFSCLSMTAVAMSVFMGLFLYAVVFQIDYFNNLHIVVLFIILAIGANNIFVLVDAWRQSEAVILEEIEVEKLKGERVQNKKKRTEGDLSRIEIDVEETKDEHHDEDYEASADEILRRRLTYAYGRAALSVANTALTTFLAFVATAVSDLAPIAAFGLFAGLVILVNLIYMLNVHPATLMVYYVYIQVPWKKRKERLNPPGTVTSKNDKPYKRKLIDRGFDKYIYYMNNTHFPKIALFCTVTFGIMMTVFAFQLETPTSVESNFNDEHMFTGFQDAFNEPFAAGNDDTLSSATAVFGISGLDDSEVPRFTTDSFRGDAIYNPNFEVHTKNAQDFLIEFCEDLKVRTCEETGCTLPTLFLPSSVNCWITDFRTWFEGQNFGDETPFSQNEDGSDANSTEEQVFERIKEFVTTDAGAIRENYALDIGVIDNVIRFTTFRYKKSMKEDQPLTIKQPVIGLMDEMTAEYIKIAQERGLPGMESMYQTSFDYVWQHTEEALVSGLYSGMAISLTASFAVVLSGTRNLVVSIYAIMGVGAIVMCVLGSIQTMGYELGTAEALAGVMVIGLAVDYTVHLGHMFVHSKKYLAEHDIGDLAKEKDETHNSRVVQSLIEQTKEKDAANFEPRTVFYNADMVHYAVDRMGVTILAGALTTFCSGVFLLLCTLAFFTKMAVLIILTVIYSTIFAFLFFVPMLRLFGPGVRNKDFHEKVAAGEVQKVTV